MSERARRLQAVGSLLGRAAGHGVLYGPLQREVFLYSEQARERLDDLGKLRPGESEEIRSRALKVGEGTVREACQSPPTEGLGLPWRGQGQLAD